MLSNKIVYYLTEFFNDHGGISPSVLMLIFSKPLNKEGRFTLPVGNTIP